MMPEARRDWKNVSHCRFATKEIGLKSPEKGKSLRLPLVRPTSFAIQPCCGFTFIELVVSIAITIILSGLLLACIVKAKSRAKAVSCTSNLRQIGVALSMYVGDFHQYPDDIDWAETRFPQYANQKLLPYPVDIAVFVCPAKKMHTQKFSRFGYGYNGLGSGHLEGPNLGLGHRNIGHVLESQIKSPTQMIAVGDSGSSVVSDWILNPNEDFNHDDVHEFPRLSISLPSDRHNGGANILFCDDHVEFGKQQQWIERQDRARRLWNNDNQPHAEGW